MKKLYLLRHAKSSWEDANLADFDRPLNDRGRRAAPLMGELMGRKGFEPDVIVSSPAARARATAVMVREAGELRAELTFDERIYEASPARLREVVAETNDEHRAIMIVGHNPGMEGFIRYLTGEPGSMPTAALAVIKLEIDKWNEIDAERGELVKIYRPKDVVI